MYLISISLGNKKFSYNKDKWYTLATLNKLILNLYTELSERIKIQYIFIKGKYYIALASPTSSTDYSLSLSLSLCGP